MPGEEGGVIVLAQADDEVVAEFIFHAASAQTVLRKKYCGAIRLGCAEEA